MTYRLQAFSSVESDLAAIPKSDRTRLRESIHCLVAEPRPPGASKLAGYADVFRIRVGRYRVVYQVRDREMIVVVIAAAERGQIYRLLKRRLKH